MAAPSDRLSGAAAGRVDVLGVAVDAVSMDEAVERCASAVRSGTPLTVGALNAAKLVGMRSDPLLRDSVDAADLLVADGMAIVWASRLLGSPLPERVAGIDLFERLLGRAEREGWSVFFLGATDAVLASLREVVAKRHPDLRVAGTRSGYFSDEESGAVAEEVAASGAHFVFVGISTPKKEIFLERWGHALGASVRQGVGGSFDVLAGAVARAPARWQSLGLEWFYRLLQEPRKMWRRYLVTNSVFLWLVGAAWLRARFSRR